MLVRRGALSHRSRAHRGANLLVSRVPATVNVAFPSEAFDIEGTLSDFASEADSGNVMHRRFCPKCGTHVFAQSEVRPHLMSVPAGTLDEPEIGKPSLPIWTAQAPSWAPIDPRIPQDEGQPPPPVRPPKP